MLKLHVVGERTDLGVGVQPENVLGVGIIRKLFGERLLLDFASDLDLADVADHRTPVSTFLVQHRHLVVDFLVGDVRDELGVTERIIDSRHTTDKLQGDGGTAVLVVDGRNLKLR
ncbi:hypothetical protein D3C78_1523780 [compost metagenome]